MTRASHWLTLGLAAAVNVAALAAVHTAMVQTSQKQHLAQQQPARIVVSAPHAIPAVAVAQQCPAPRVL